MVLLAIAFLSALFVLAMKPDNPYDFDNMPVSSMGYKTKDEMREEDPDIDEEFLEIIYDDQFCADREEFEEWVKKMQEG